MVKMPKIRNAVTLLNIGLGVVGVSLGVLPLLGITAPTIVTSIGWIMVGVAGVMFLFGRKRI